MAADWESTTLGKIADFVSGGTPSKDNLAYWGGVIPWVSAKDMKRFHLSDTEDHVTDEGVSGTKLVPEGTVFLLARGMTLLNDIPISIADRPMTFNQDVKAVQPKAGVSKDYLPYLLLAAKPRLLSLVDLAGHGTGRLNSDQLKSLDVLIPPEPEQHAIAHVLGMLDDKIELNRQMNKTLEAIARALFKSWFVDFDPVRAKAEDRDPDLPMPLADVFPASFEGSDLGGIPKGWNAGRVADIARLSREGFNPGEFPDEVFEHYSIPAFDEGRAAKLEAGGTIKSNKFIVLPNCTLLSKLNPRIPRIWLPDLRRPNRAVCSTEFLVMLPKPNVSREFLFCLFSSIDFARAFATLVTGTSSSHQRVKPESLLEMSIVVSTAPVIQQFTRVVEPLFERIDRSIAESHTLVALRDGLLPKLVSGELRVPATAGLVEGQA